MVRYARLSSNIRRVEAFTLVELMLVVVMGAMVFAGAVSIVLSHIRTSSRMGALLHLQDHCGWVQFLINREIEQAQSAAGGGNQLALAVPGFGEPIVYQLNTTSRQLWRTGPEIDAQGRLQAGSSSRTDLVARDVQAFVVTITNPRSPRYQITMQDATGATITISQDDGRDGGAYCRARVIGRTTTTP